jgi:hypothetical protein
MFRVTSLLTLVILAFLSNGCSTLGMTASKFRPAKGPQGVNMSITTAQGMLSGELIEVRDTGIVVLADQKLRFLPYTDIRYSKVDQYSSYGPISQRKAPKPDAKEQLRLLSRFPQGLTPELTRQLLDAYGQTELPGLKP